MVINNPSRSRCILNSESCMALCSLAREAVGWFGDSSHPTANSRLSLSIMILIPGKNTTRSRTNSDAFVKLHSMSI
jgi:hypothetical protein